MKSRLLKSCIELIVLIELGGACPLFLPPQGWLAAFVTKSLHSRSVVARCRFSRRISSPQALKDILPISASPVVRGSRGVLTPRAESPSLNGIDDDTDSIHSMTEMIQSRSQQSSPALYARSISPLVQSISIEQQHSILRSPAQPLTGVSRHFVHSSRVDANSSSMPIRRSFDSDSDDDLDPPLEDHLPSPCCDSKMDLITSMLKGTSFVEPPTGRLSDLFKQRRHSSVS